MNGRHLLAIPESAPVLDRESRPFFSLLLAWKKTKKKKTSGKELGNKPRSFDVISPHCSYACRRTPPKQIKAILVYVPQCYLSMVESVCGTAASSLNDSCGVLLHAVPSQITRVITRSQTAITFFSPESNPRAQVLITGALRRVYHARGGQDGRRPHSAPPQSPESADVTSPDLHCCSNAQHP